jgi:hypothetical protein
MFAPSGRISWRAWNSDRRHETGPLVRLAGALRIGVSQRVVQLQASCFAHAAGLGEEEEAAPAAVVLTWPSSSTARWSS